jgi:hypothetical protein
MRAFRTVLVFSLLAAEVTAAARARESRPWSYGELEQNSDLIVIATPVQVRHLDEPAELPGSAHSVLGVETRFTVLAVLKGKRDLKDLVLFQWRLRPDGPIWNGPVLKTFEPEAGEDFLLFLAEGSDGRFEAVAGQMDLDFSVKGLGRSLPGLPRKRLNPPAD